MSNPLHILATTALLAVLLTSCAPAAPPPTPSPTNRITGFRTITVQIQHDLEPADLRGATYFIGPVPGPQTVAQRQHLRRLDRILQPAGLIRTNPANALYIAELTLTVTGIETAVGTSDWLPAHLLTLKLHQITGPPDYYLTRYHASARLSDMFLPTPDQSIPLLLDFLFTTNFPGQDGTHRSVKDPPPKL